MRSRLHLEVAGAVHVGEGAPPARTMQPEDSRCHVPKATKATFAPSTFLPIAPPAIHVEPTPRRLGSCCFFALQLCNQQGFTIRHWLLAALY